MYKPIYQHLFMLLFSLNTSSLAYIFISEIEAQHFGGTDHTEFIELYNNESVNVKLDNYILVLYDGADTETVTVPGPPIRNETRGKAYTVIYLNGACISGQDYFLIGSPTVNPAPNKKFDLPADNLRNGVSAAAAAVVLYYNEIPGSYQVGMPVTSSNMADAIVYNKEGDTGGDNLIPYLMPHQPVRREDKDYHDTLSRCGWTPSNTVDFVETGGSPGGNNTCPAGTTVTVPSATPSAFCNVSQIPDVTCYTIYTNARSWQQAKRNCEAMNQTLAVIETQDEFNMIRNTTEDEKLTEEMWVGLSDNQARAHFRWINGMNLHFNGWDTSYPRQRAHTSCVSLLPTNGFRNRQCVASLSYICETHNAGCTDYSHSLECWDNIRDCYCPEWGDTISIVHTDEYVEVLPGQYLVLSVVSMDVADYLEEHTRLPIVKMGTIEPQATKHTWNHVVNSWGINEIYNDLNGSLRVLHNYHKTSYHWESTHTGGVPHGAYATKRQGRAYYVMRWLVPPAYKVYALASFELGQLCTSSVNNVQCSDNYDILVVAGPCGGVSAYGERSCYKESWPQQGNYDNVKLICAGSDYDGMMASIPDERTKTKLVNDSNSSMFSGNLYIGLHSPVSPGSYQWEDGTPVAWTHWDPSQPLGDASKKKKVPTATLR